MHCARADDRSVPEQMCVPTISRQSWWRCLAVLVCAAALGGCRSQSPDPAPEYRPTASVREVMHGIIAPSAEVIWDAVTTSTTAQGVEHTMPRTDKDWETVEHSTLTLLEASNLLLMPGRRVARETQADSPDVELAPMDIQALIERTRPQWASKAMALHDASRAVLAAIEKKDVQGLFDGGGAVYAACEGCHRTYWFPERSGRASGGSLP
jgi:hypothetical protein